MKLIMCITNCITIRNTTSRIIVLQNVLQTVIQDTGYFHPDI